MPYHMIYVRDDDGMWSPQFGDRDREAVKQERVDSYLRQRGCGYPGDCKYAAKDIRIERFDRVPTQGQVSNRTDRLNGV